MFSSRRTTPPPTWGPPPGRPAIATPEWARERGTPSVGWGLRLAIGFAMLALVSASAVFVWMGMWFHTPRPVDLLIVGAGYETNLAVPHNVAGWRTAGLLTGIREANGWRTIAPPLRLQIGDRWDRDLESADAPTVIVMLALHGGSDELGAYLLPDNTDGQAVAEQRIRVADIIDRLAQLPAEQAKLLILDATQLESSQALGLPRNDFARALSELGTRIESVPNLVVVTSSGPDQRSWVCPEYGETIFGRAVREALSGNANDLNGDGVLTLRETLQSVIVRVKTWAQLNRATQQVPMVFPSGVEGVRRANGVMIGVANPQPIEIPNPPTDVIPQDLGTAWAEVAAIRVWEPAPNVYAPQIWRRYLAAALRYESLIFAHDSVNADAMRDQMRRLAEQLNLARQLVLDSSQNTIAMPALNGQLTITPEAAAAAQELWSAELASAPKLWAQRLTTLPKTAFVTVPFRLGVMQRLMELEASSPTLALDQLQTLLRLVHDPARPSPVESHFVAILQRDGVPGAVPNPLLRQGIHLRGLAERAALGVSDTLPGYPYAEQVAPFTQKLLDAADQDRLAGQDRLFATDEGSFVAARSHLDRAATGYQHVLTVASDTRKVLSTRTKVAGELPFYSAWLAAVHRSDNADEWRTLNDTVDRVVAMWAEWHQLGDDFDAAEVAPDPTTVMKSLAARADQLLGKLNQLAETYSDRMVELAVADLPSIWRDAEAGLEVPFLDFEARRRLLLNIRRTSWIFLSQSASSAKPAATFEQQQTRSDERAQRQGRLSLAMLGQKWFDRPDLGQPSPNWESFDIVAHRLKTFAADPNGWQSLRFVGTALGQRFQIIPTDVNARLKQPTRTNVHLADRLTRIVIPGPDIRITGNPAEKRRQYFLSQLFLQLARRTWTEHWFAADRDDEPYYLQAGRLYLADAADSSGRADVQKLYDDSGRLRLIAAPGPLGDTGPLTLTSELSAAIPDRLEPAPGVTVPPGLAVWDAIPGSGLELTADSQPGRLTVMVGSVAATATPTVRNAGMIAAEATPPSRSSPSLTNVRFRAWFRGQWLEHERPIVVYPRPVITVNQLPTPQEASLAVRATPDLFRRFGVGTGGIAFVLDCSGSMGVPSGTPFTASAKYAQATKVLEEVLREIPAGTKVSVRVFGQAVGALKTATVPEDTIHVVLPPTEWKPSDPTQLTRVMTQIRYPALEPWNESPILRAMSSAKNDLAEDRGFKTIIVLTDGKDNRFDKDLKLNPDNKDFPTLLQSVFRGSGITVHVIGFRVVAKELDEVRKQFAALAKLDPPGSFTTTNEVEELTAALKRALRQELRYWVETEDRLPVASVPSAGMQVGAGLSGDHWLTPGLKAGGYRIRAQADHRSDTDIVVRPADRLLLELSGERDRLQFRRVLLASDYPGVPTRSQSGWQVTVPQLQRLGSRFQALAWLEKRFDPAEDVLQMLRPKDVWWELSAPSDIALTWQPVPGYPAPAWGFAAPSFPDPPARPRLQVWWNPDQETPSVRLDRSADFHAISDLTDRRLIVDDAPAVVRQVVVENHIVDTADGQRGAKSCLVVRVLHPPDSPVRVRVRGPVFEGSSHWYYPKAGETAAVFWPADAQRVAAQVRAVEVQSIREFRRIAEKRGFTASFDDLPSPDPVNERPRTPVPLP